MNIGTAAAAGLEKLLAGLENIQTTADGRWNARCPCHDDRHNSLSISVASDGTVLLKCFAGCETSDILTDVGLEYRDLFPSPNGKTPSRIVAVYDYSDENGTLLFQVVRFEPKTFRQRRPQVVGGWSWSVRNIRRVLYRLPELLAANPSPPVFVVEGEKDVDRLMKLGLVATSNAGGAGKWRTEYNDSLAGRHVVILPDADDPGRKHAETVAKALYPVAESVKVLELPELREKEDVSDYLARSGTAEQLLDLARDGEHWKPSEEGSHKTFPAWRAFPTDLLPYPLGAYVREGAASLVCDESYVALPLLAAVASAIGNARRILLKRTWQEVAVIWTATIGQSGTMKSPAHDLALVALRSRQSDRFAEYKEQLEKYEREILEYELDLKHWKSNGHKQGLPPPEQPGEPVAVRNLLNDTTVEALAQMLELQPRGVLLERDELSGWLRSFDQYKPKAGGDVGHYLSMHRAGPVTVDRKSSRVIHVPRAAVSITGTIQPEILRGTLRRGSQTDQ